MQSVDPHYKIEGYINSDTKDLKGFEYNFVSLIALDGIDDFIIQKGISEIVVASQKTEGITVELYNKLIDLLENGFEIDYSKPFSMARCPTTFQNPQETPVSSNERCFPQSGCARYF